MLLDPSEPLFIVGDLNMDLRSTKGIDLRDFLIRNELKNFVNQHTRVCRSYYKKKKKYQTSKTLIDVIIHNQNRILETKVIGCPFSDHKFIIAALDFTSTKSNPFINIGRSLSEKNLILIGDHLSNLNFSFNKDDNDIDGIWINLKKQIINIVDLIAPLNKFKERPKQIAPWEDEELLEKRRSRDHYYFKYTNLNISFTNAEKSFNLRKYRKLRAECQSLQRIKMKEYFNSKKSVISKIANSIGNFTLLLSK